MEYVEGYELYEFLAITGAFNEKICRYYFKQMLMGLHHLHSRGICHRDLKPENILLDNDLNIKIIDFGFATELSGKNGTGFNNTYLGTKPYMAPEILIHQEYQGKIVDLFALGVILFNLYALDVPFKEAHKKD